MRAPAAGLLSLPWACIMGLRNAAYDRGLLPAIAAGLPVLCVGNISLGGVGKSPLVMHLARELAARRPVHWLDWHPGPGPLAVLSRGYGRRSRGFVLVSRGQGPLVPVEQSGDEPAVCARLCPGVVVAVCEDRVEGARRLRELGCGGILLDDGFQHRRLARDTDLLVWDCGLDPAREALLPFGRLRESPLAATRAQTLLFSRVPGEEVLFRRLAWFRRITQVPAFKLGLAPDGLHDADTGAALALPMGSWGLFSGLGNPAQFERDARATLEPALGPPCLTRRFPDHHRFRPADLAGLALAVRDHRLTLLLTTWKDAVRLPADHGLPIAVLGQRVDVRPLA
jgi:tetraacyldisaccharide 4'-kinase